MSKIVILDSFNTQIITENHQLVRVASKAQCTLLMHFMKHSNVALALLQNPIKYLWRYVEDGE